MSTVKEKCEFIVWNNRKFIVYNVIPFLAIPIFLSSILHELGHAVGNGLTGGTFGFASEFGNVIGGFSITGLQFIFPSMSITVSDVGNYLVMLLAGPAVVIVGFWLIASRWNKVDLAPSSRCEGYNSWMKIRGVVWGSMVAGWMDSVYILPISVFPNALHGDGISLYNTFEDMGWTLKASPEIFSTVIDVDVNFGYILGISAILVTAYYTLLVLGINSRKLIQGVLGCSWPPWSDDRCQI